MIPTSIYAIKALFLMLQPICLHLRGLVNSLYEGDNFCDFLFAFLHKKPVLKGSTLKGRNPSF